MYNKEVVDKLICFIGRLNDSNISKAEVCELVKNEFGLIQDRKIFYCEDFAIRFCSSKNRKAPNTIIALARLKKYDDKPFIVCVVTPIQKYLLLANTTFVKKISHSSQGLRIDNIRGSFNGSNLIYKIGELENVPENFESLFDFHMEFTFEENLERLVESTSNIKGRNNKFELNTENKQNIFSAIDRTKTFIKSNEYVELKNDLDRRVENVKEEILTVCSIDNVNQRGRAIEYLITCEEPELKEKIIHALRANENIPCFTTKDGLGDYIKIFEKYHTEIDIKSKILSLKGNPKGYNVDKLLRLLAKEDSIYMIYLVGIDNNGEIITRLCSMFDYRLIDATRVISQWSGRNSRGVTQFIGSGLVEILGNEDKTCIDNEKAIALLKEFMEK